MRNNNIINPYILYARGEATLSPDRDSALANRLNWHKEQFLNKKADDHMREIDGKVFAYHDRAHKENVIGDILLQVFIARENGRDISRRIENLAIIAGSYHDTGFSNVNWKDDKPQDGHEERSVQLFLQDVLDTTQTPPIIREGLNVIDVAIIMLAIRKTQLQPINGDMVQPDTSNEEIIGTIHEVERMLALEETRESAINEHVYGDFREVAGFVANGDVANFGQPNFFPINRRVREELTNIDRKKGRVISRRGLSYLEREIAELQAEIGFLVFTAEHLVGAHRWKNEEARQAWDLKKTQNERDLDEMIRQRREEMAVLQIRLAKASA